MRWPFSVKPHPDELLSSFLVRAAHRHGLSPYRFCAFHFPETPVWNRDIDRSASDALLEAIAEKTGLPLTSVVGTTMRGVEVRLGVRVTGGAGRWVNTVGIYHRLRRRWGMQYCPDCLAERPVFYRSWRLSWAVVCNRHRISLQDACPHCDAPLAIHRQQVSVRLCHECSCPLTKRNGQQWSWEMLHGAQSRYEQALTCGCAVIGQDTIPARELFAGTRVLAMVAVTPRTAHADRSRVRELPLELSRMNERASVLVKLERLLAQWPEGFSAVARERHLTQRSFMRCSLPGWMAAVVRQLPKGHARNVASPSRGRKTLEQRLQALRKQGVEGRTARAELLWRAANG